MPLFLQRDQSSPRSRVASTGSRIAFGTWRTRFPRLPHSCVGRSGQCGVSFLPAASPDARRLTFLDDNPDTIQPLISDHALTYPDP